MRTIFLTTDGRRVPVAAGDVGATVTQAREQGLRGFIAAEAGEHRGHGPVTLLQLGAINASAGDWGAATFAFHAARVGLTVPSGDEDAADAVRDLLAARKRLSKAETRVLELRF